MNSALFIRGGAIGDFILTLPSLHAFREQCPDARVEILGYPHIAELARGRFYAQAVRPVDHRGAAGFFVPDGDLDRDLSRYLGGFSLIVSYLYDPDGIFLKNLKRASARRVLATDCRPGNDGLHAMDHLARWLPEAGIAKPLGPPRVYPNVEDLRRAKEILGESKIPCIALHPGSGSPSKNWPVARFLELAEWIKEQKLRVLVMEGPADSEAAAAFWKDARSQGCIRCQGHALPIVAAILQMCRIFVGHDSGISHLSAAVQTPTVALFGPTDPRIWAPRGKSVVVLQRGREVAAVPLKRVQDSLDRLLASSPPESGLSTKMR